MKKLYVIDASGYLYSSYYAIRNMTNPQGESTNALFGFIRSVLKLIKDFSPTHLVSVFDGPNNGKKRIELYSEYKAHRKESPRDLPYQITWAREFCQLMGIPSFNIPDVEADDVMGSIAVWAEKHGFKTYLCTTDKDMCQLVDDHVFLLNTRKENLVVDSAQVRELHGVPPEQMVDLLALIGDSSDNVPGVPGIGPKTAVQLLQQFGSLDKLLSHTSQVEGEKKRALIEENKELARISRELVTIDTKVEIPHKEEAYQIGHPHYDDLKAFYGKMHFNSLLKELGNVPSDAGKKVEEVPVKYHLVDTPDELHTLISLLKKQKAISIDTETTGTRPLTSELVGIGLGFEPHEAWYIPVNGNLGLSTVLKAIKPILEDKQIGFYGHNIKYDYQIFANYDIIIAHICFDTILASYLLNSHQRVHSLDALTLENFGYNKIPISDLIGKGKSTITMREVPIDKVKTYCCEDVDMTCRLKLKLEKELDERGLTHLLTELELPLLKVLAHMERFGIYLDVPCLQKHSVSITKEIEKIAEEIYSLAGEEFNLNSPKQLSEIMQHKLHIKLPKKTATGFSTSADILEELQWDYPIAKAILHYRSLEKLRSTYIDSLPGDVNPKTHRIHCTFNQSVAATGRLSCQDPNLQNIPVRTEEGRKIREAFRPQMKGWSYLSADYSQMELRLLAHLSEDPKLIAAFRHGEDIHAATASAIFHVPLNEVTKEQRNQAKAVNFGIIYGQQAYGLSKELGIEMKEASRIIDTYFKEHPYVHRYLEHSKEQARKTGKAVTFTGRERLIGEITSKNAQLRLFAERLALNTPLQGAGADIIKKAMLIIDQAVTQQKLKGFMILQIHDELIFEIPDTEIEQWKPLVQSAMQEVVHLKVPLEVNISLGKNWKEC